MSEPPQLGRKNRIYKPCDQPQRCTRQTFSHRKQTWNMNSLNPASAPQETFALLADCRHQLPTWKYCCLAWPCDTSAPKDWLWRASINTCGSYHPTPPGQSHKEPPWVPSSKHTRRLILPCRTACFHMRRFWFDRKTVFSKTSSLTASWVAATATVNLGGCLPWRSVCKGAVKRHSH